MSTKKILGITVAVLLCVTVYGASNVSAGGSIDVNMGSNMEPTGSGSFKLLLLFLPVYILFPELLRRVL